MPAVSKAQFRMMRDVCKGTRKPTGSLTKDQACEFVAGQTMKGLPARARNSKKKRRGKKYR